MFHLENTYLQDFLDSSDSFASELLQIRRNIYQEYWRNVSVLLVEVSGSMNSWLFEYLE